ncbi:MAG: hypothetical protein QXG65_04180 [Thermoplasmata archaeon]
MSGEPNTATVSPPSPTNAPFAQHVPGGIRVAYAVLGIIAMAFAIALLASFFASGFVWTLTLYVFAVVALLAMGVADIVSATSHAEAPSGIRTLRLILGVIIIIFAFVALVDIRFALLAVWVFVSVGLLFQGLFLVAGVGASTHLEGWQRGVASALGVIDIVLAFFAILVPVFAFVFVGFLIAIAAIAVAIYFLTIASTGVRRPMPPVLTIPGFPPMGGAPGTGGSPPAGGQA